MKNLHLFIPIVPVPKARPRLGKHGAYTPQKTVQYENALKKAFKEAWGDNTPPMQGPIMVEVWFYMPRPKSTPKKKQFPDTKPDIDNLEKAVLDALDFSFSDYNRKIAKKNKLIAAKQDGTPLLEKIENGRVIDNDSRIVSKISHKRFFDTSGKSEPGIEIILHEMSETTLNYEGIISPIAVVFSKNYEVEKAQKISQVLLKKGYCPLYLDAGEYSKQTTRYTHEVLKASGALCVIEEKKEGPDNQNLQSTINIAEQLGKEIFKINL